MAVIPFQLMFFFNTRVNYLQCLNRGHEAQCDLQSFLTDNMEWSYNISFLALFTQNGMQAVSMIAITFDHSDVQVIVRI